MFPPALKGILVLVLSGIVAILLGSLIGQGDFSTLILLSYAAVGMFLVMVPGYLPLLALGLLNPMIVPVPFIHGFPFLAIMMGVCVLKLTFRDALTHVELRDYRHCLQWWMVIFFGLVALRYLTKPVLPNLAGFGANVTGFRSYLNYALCFGILVGLPAFIKTREDFLKVFTWMAIISTGFILVLCPLVFTKSAEVAVWFLRLGMSAGFFDNGWLRFLALPSFGLVLVTLSLAPRTMPVSKVVRRGAFCLGLLATLLGGSRSNLLMIVIVVPLSFLLRREFARFWLTGAAATILIAVGTYLVETTEIKTGFGFMRVLALTSKRVANETDAVGTWEWRQIRWQRAIAEIKKDPWLGKGYGGVENAFLATNMNEAEDARLEIDLAAGGIHNGFLATAYALGLPSAICFILGVAFLLHRCTRQIGDTLKTDPLLADIQQVLVVNLVGLMGAIYIGADLNTPIIWFYIALAAIALRIRQTELRAVTPR